MTKPRTVIRKYGDRRLYDSAAKSYVKISDVARMVREGVDVQVVDARSGKDLTRVVLTQIIVEESRDQETGPPLALLRQLVMASDRATHEFLSSYLKGTLELYHKSQQLIQSGISEARQKVASPLEFVKDLLTGHEGQRDADGGELEELRRRVRELEARLAHLTAAAPRKRKAPGKRSGGVR